MGAKLLHIIRRFGYPGAKLKVLSLKRIEIRRISVIRIPIELPYLKKINMSSQNHTECECVKDLDL